MSLRCTAPRHRYRSALSFGEHACSFAGGVAGSKIKRGSRSDCWRFRMMGMLAQRSNWWVPGLPKQAPPSVYCLLSRRAVFARFSKREPAGKAHCYLGQGPRDRFLAAPGGPWPIALLASTGCWRGRPLHHWFLGANHDNDRLSMLRNTQRSALGKLAFCKRPLKEAVAGRFIGGYAEWAMIEREQ